MELFHMSDIIPILGLPYPPAGRSDYNIPCPCCDDNPRKKHLNINLRRDVFRCPRCGFAGGVFDLYAHYTGIPRDSVRAALIERLNVQGQIPSPKRRYLCRRKYRKIRLLTSMQEMPLIRPFLRACPWPPTIWKTCWEEA